MRRTPTKTVQQRRLEYLADFSDILRTTWNCVIGTKSIVSELEKGDRSREQLLRTMEAGYIPPDVKIR